MEAAVCPMQKYIDIPRVLSIKDPKLWMVKCSIGHEWEAVRGMGSLIDLEGPMIPIPLINITKEDSTMRDGHREHKYSTKGSSKMRPLYK